MKAMYTAVNKVAVIVDILGHPGEDYPADVVRVRLPSGEEVNVYRKYLSKEHDAPGVRSLPIIKIGSTRYYVDERLNELRNVDDPMDREKMEGSAEFYIETFGEKAPAFTPAQVERAAGRVWNK